jgi:hypothetical protein
MTTVDYPDYQRHIANADAISVTGVPLLSMATSLFNVSVLTSVPAAGSLTIPGSPFSLNQIGYELFVKVLANAASTFPFGRLVLTWSDSVSGNTVWLDKWSLAGGNPSSAPYIGVGPTKGDQVSVTFFNDDPVNAMSIAMSMVQNSRVFVRDDLRNSSVQAIPNLTRGNYSIDAGILVNTIPNLGAGASANRVMAFYAGQVSLSMSATQPYSVAVLAYNGEVSLVLPSVVFAGAVVPAGGGQLQAAFSLPRCFCQISITNNGGAAANFTATVTVSEQQA